MTARNLESRVKRLEADSIEESCMIVPAYPGQSKEEAREEYFKERPDMRNYSELYSFLFVKMFRERNGA